MSEATQTVAPVVSLTEGAAVKVRDLLSREDLKAMVDKVRESSPAVVDELIPTVLTMGGLDEQACRQMTEAAVRSVSSGDWPGL